MTVKYFGDEDAEEHRCLLARNKYLFNTSEVNFSVSQYISAFIVHLTFFLILGPFINVLAIFSTRCRTVLRNMDFFIQPTFDFFFQTTVYCAALLTIIAFVWMNLANDNDWPAVDVVLIKLIVLSTIIRTTSIAGKYATYPVKQWLKVQNVVLDRPEKQKEMTLLAW